MNVIENLQKLIAQRDVVRASLAVKDAYGADVLLEFTSFDLCPLSVLWRFQNETPHFTFHSDLKVGQGLEMIVDRWIGLLPLVKRFIAQRGPFKQTIVINFADEGVDPGIAFSDWRSERTLITDPVFIGHQAYERARQCFSDERQRPWSDRRDVAFWRGSSTGYRPGTKQPLPRAQLCEIARSEKARNFDVGITQIVDVDEEHRTLIETKGYLTNYETWELLDQYKFHIDIDGHSNSWPGLLLKLHSGGLVFKVESLLGHKQWYYERLLPWQNYVPVKADMSDLISLVEYFRRNDADARRIAAEGQKLARSMDLETELDKGVSAIASHLIKMEIAELYDH